MTTASGHRPVDPELAYPGDRSGTWFGVIFGLLGGGGILFFWLLGAIGLLRQDSGLITQIGLEGIWRMAFLSYPFVFLGCLVVGGLLVAAKRDLEGVGVIGLPVVLTVLFHQALIHLRPF